MRAVVTGACGFLGSALCLSLAREGYEVAGIDAFCGPMPRARQHENRQRLSGGGVKMHEANLRDAELAPLLDGVEHVFHLASIPGFRSFPTDSVATQRLIDACAASDTIERFVYASSCDVYGDVPPPQSESGASRPRSGNGYTKLAGEHLATSYAVSGRVPALSVRLFSVYGPGQRPDMAFSRFIEALHERRALVVAGTGAQRHDFTYVEDAVAGLSLAALHGEPGAVYNIGSGVTSSVRDAIGMLETITALGATVTPGKDLPAPPDACADLTRSHGELRYKPRVALDTGLARQVLWYRLRAPMTVEADIRHLSIVTPRK